jgi:hypothetical protein
MSRPNEARPRTAWRSAVTLIGLVALGCAAVSLASDNNSAARVTIGASAPDGSDEAKPARAYDEKLAASAAKAPKIPRSLLRCWQGGRMVFEGRGYGTLPQSHVAAELKPADGAGGRVQVLDLYQGLCVLELPD